MCRIRRISSWHTLCVRRGKQNAESLDCGLTRLYKNKNQKTQFTARNMKTKQVVAMAMMALVMSLGAGTVLAQNNDNNSKKGDNNNGGQGRQRGGGNFDPAQFQQRIMDNY